MKKIILLSILVLLITTGCAFHSGLTRNLNENQTQVVLSKNNFKVIKTVYGYSRTLKVFGIGGLSKQALIAEARNDMLQNVQMEGTSRALINEVVEVKRTYYYIFASEFKVTVSATVIEFTE